MANNGAFCVSGGGRVDCSGNSPTPIVQEQKPKVSCDIEAKEPGATEINSAAELKQYCSDPANVQDATHKNIIGCAEGYTADLENVIIIETACTDPDLMAKTAKTFQNGGQCASTGLINNGCTKL
jgi:hypothetical protein